VSGTRQGWATGRPGAAARPAPGQTDEPAGPADEQAGHTAEKDGRTAEGAGHTAEQAGRTAEGAGQTAEQAGHTERPSGQAAAPARESLAPARGPLDQILGELADIAAEWAPTAGRLLLGLVLAWFGYHELVRPGAWTGYVPVLSETSNLAVAAVLIHGWILFMLAVALVAGIAPRAAAAVASVVMLEIVISLTVSGLNDTALRDVGVLGLAVCLTGCRHRRLVLRG
jgi:uncharacterized membrane protein YphA (DoxX/SURF4 family)